MIVNPRPRNLCEFTTLKADFFSSGFQGLSNPYDFSYLKTEIVQWLDEIEGEVYWELVATDDFYYGVDYYEFINEFNFVFYFRRAADAVLFKFQWFEGR